MSTTIDPGKQSDEIVVDTIRDGLRADLTDPLEPRDGSAMVLTDFPSRDVTYPHVIVRELGDSSRQLDRRADLREHDYDVRIEVIGRSSTEMYALRSEVSAWVEANVETLRSVGFGDLETSSGSSDWDPTAEGVSWQITISGTLYT